MRRFHRWRSSRYLRISPLHLEFHAPLPASRSAVCQARPRLSRGISQGTYAPAYMRFKPSNSEQRLHPSYYRGCWHEVSRCFLWDRSSSGLTALAFLHPDSSLHPEGLNPTHGVAGSGLRPLPKIRYCSPPWRSGQCLSPDVAGQPLSPATRRCLGKPLPHQQADTTQTAPEPVPEGPLVRRPFDHRTSSGITCTFAKGPKTAVIPELGVRYLCITHPCATDFPYDYS